MFINDNDLRLLGWHPVSRALPQGVVAHTYQPVAGAPPRLLGERIESQTLTVSGVVVASTRAQAHARADQIEALCRLRAADPHRVRFPDQPAGREFVGRLAKIERADFGRRWQDPALHLSLTFSLTTPYARATAETVHPLAADGAGITSVLLALGVGASPLRIVVHQPTAGVTISVTDADGYAIRSLVWEGDASAGPLIVDASTMSTVQGATRVLDDVRADSIYPVADPSAGAARARVAGAQPGSPVTVSYRSLYRF
jgi:hypothetical protein